MLTSISTMQDLDRCNNATLRQNRQSPLEPLSHSRTPLRPLPYGTALATHMSLNVARRTCHWYLARYCTTADNFAFT